jgi:catechol 2,3-dioxygenase-like lactoylglutathione lyase family enzyme
VRSIHHLAIGAADVDALARFYQDRLGLRESARHDDKAGLRSVWLAAGDAILMIERATEPRDAPPPGQPGGLFLVAFQVSPEERAALEKSLSEAGFPREDATAYTSYFRDPEGNRFALSHYPDAGR